MKRNQVLTSSILLLQIIIQYISTHKNSVKTETYKMFITVDNKCHTTSDCLCSDI